MSRQVLMTDDDYHGCDNECEDLVCGHCGNQDCVWYDDFLESEDDE